MRKIIFDLFFAQPHNNNKFHGGGEYAKTVFLNLANNISDTSRLHVLFNDKEYLDETIRGALRQKRIEVHDVKNISEIYDVIRIQSKDNRVLFFTGMMYPYFRNSFGGNVFSVGVCHGLRMIELPRDRYSIFYSRSFKSFARELVRMLIPVSILRAHSIKKYRNALANFDLIYTVSQHSLYAINTYLLSDDLNIDLKVHYQTLKYNSRAIEMVNNELEKEYRNGQYILMISAGRWEKNSYRGVRAIDSLLSEKKMCGYYAVVLGNYPQLLRKKVKNKNRFIFKDYVSTDELEYAYKNCKIFFYPSLNEGYGLPPMEAMKYGKTCVISAVCSLPEVYGEAVYYCNPYDIVEMKVRLLEALDKEISIEIIERKKKQLFKIQSESTQELVHKILEDE